MREVIKMPNQKQKNSSRNFRRGIGWFYVGRVDIGNFHAIFVKELGLRGHWEDEDGDWIPDGEVIKKLRQAGWTVMEREHFLCVSQYFWLRSKDPTSKLICK